VKFFLFLCLLNIQVVAQNIVVTAQTDLQTIALNQLLTFTISIKYDESQPRDIQIPDSFEITNFKILNQWSGPQSSVSIINGHLKKTQLLKYHYELQAQKQGTLTIPSLDVKVNGRTYRTKPINVVVLQKQNTPPAQKGLPLNPTNPLSIDPFFDSFFKPLQRFSINPNVNTAVKIQLQLNKKTVYEGEALTADWSLLSSSGNIQSEVHKSPKLKDFWKESLKVDPQGQFVGTVVINNVLYRKTLFDSMMLFPLKSGSLQVDSYFLKVSSVFGFRSSSQIKKSPLKIIQVKPLPLKGRRAFSGAVGDFQVQAVVTDKQVKVNEPLSYLLKFEGDGHPQFIQSPKIPFPEEFKMYSPVEKSKFLPQGKSFKHYEFILIPKEEGLFKIPAYEISTFNPTSGTYIYHQMPSVQIQVLKGDRASEEGLKFFDKDTQSNPNQNLFQQLDSFFWPSFLNHQFLKKFWIFFYLFVSLVFILWTFWPLRKKSPSVRRKLKEGLQEVDVLIRQGNYKSSAMKLVSLVYMVLYQFDSQGTSTDWMGLVKKLPPSFYDQQGEALVGLMKDLEELSFAPQNLSKPAQLHRIKVLYLKTNRILGQLLETKQQVRKK